MPITLRSTLSLSAALSALAAAPALAGDQPVDPQTIVITAPRGSLPDLPTQAVRRAEDELATAPDAAAFIARQPGMALIGNGALSGQVQIRGLFGERVLLRVNDQHFASGGPNAMDPVMHYAPMVLVDRVEIARGVSPVRDGPGLGGGVNAVLKQVRFGTGSRLAPQLDVTSQYRSAEDGWAIGGMAGLANEHVRLGAIASWEEGGDLRYPGGRVAGTSYRRAVYGVQAGFKAGEGELSLECRRQETGASGNPPFAMDIVYFRTDFARLAYEGQISDDLRLEARADYTGVDHRMNNFTLRPAPMTAMTRQSDATAGTIGGGLSLRWGSAGRHLRLGGDAELVDKSFLIVNPLMPAFWVTPIDNGESQRIGAFVEVRGALGPIEAEAGLRLDRHTASVAAPRLGPGVPAGPVGLAASFAAGDRRWEGTTLDAALRLWADLGTLTPRLTLARKTRVPSLVERYSWLPTEASGGLADGNIYVGDQALRPEQAWIAEAGFDWAAGSAYLRPTVFYRRIDDYIQGVPYDATPGVVNTPVEMVASASGDSTPLRFANVDARLYGADLAFGARIAGPLRIDGVASLVRGERRDIADSLYRIAPDSLRVALGWEQERWGLAVEGQGVAAQGRVSVTNSEARTAGYVLAAVHGYWLAVPGVRIDAGIENLLDRSYTEHLAGYNRNAGSSIPVGARLPGAGRSAFVRLRVTMP